MIRALIVAACFIPLGLSFYVNREEPIATILDKPETGFSIVVAGMAVLVGSGSVLHGPGGSVR